MTNLKESSILPIEDRSFVSKGKCLSELKNLPSNLFALFPTVKKHFNAEIRNTPPEARGRDLEATLFNSKMVQSIQSYFPYDCRYVKYGRFILQKYGYIFLLGVTIKECHII